MMRLTILLLVFTSAFSTAYSQSTSSLSNTEVLSSEDFVILEDDNWSFYVDQENKTYFIDFEKINFNLSDIIVTNEDGEVIFKDDVIDLPVDTIYELDFVEFGSGAYRVELRSFTSIIRKDVQIK